MNRKLAGLFIASLFHRPFASLLSLLAIALGVALGLAVQLIHGAALDEFGRSARELAGEADLQVVGSREGFDESLYWVLAQRKEVSEASPVIEVEARLPGRDRSLRIYGVDVFRVVHVQAALVPQIDEGGDRLATLDRDTVFLTAAARAMMDGREAFEVQSGVNVHTLRIAGAVPGAMAGQAYGVMDIAAVQQTFDHLGRLSRIDLRLAPGVRREEARVTLLDLMPPGVEIRTPEASSGEVMALSRAYRVNLTMLAAIALLTGGFLIFSTQWLSVVRRRREFAVLRALGMARADLLRGVLIEGGLTGLVGGLLGLVLGHGVTVLAFELIGGDLGAGYFTDIRPELVISPAVNAAYLALGILAGVAGAWLPARDAARAQPAVALKAGSAEGVVQQIGRGRSPAVLGCLVLAALACQLPPIAWTPVGGYLAIALVLCAAVLVLPGCTRFAVRLLDFGRGVLWRLARGRLSAIPGQAVVAGAGVVTSVALAVSMAVMVSSFRVSVDDWLSKVLPADLYLRASASSSTGYLDASALAWISGLPGVSSLTPLRAQTLRLIDGRPPVTLIARDVEGGVALPLVSVAAPEKGGAADGEALPSVWISETLVDLLGLAPGMRLDLPLGGSRVGFRVAGVWRDYARQNGAVIIERSIYLELTRDDRVNDVAIELTDPGLADEISVALRSRFGADRIEIARRDEIRALSLAIFDRTFLITYLMEAVAILIGLFGVAATFAALATARRGEFALLRHLGVRRREIARLIAFEGGLTAFAGVMVGMLAGGAVAWILIEVVNRQSFHWSMDLHVPTLGLALFGLSMVLLAACVAPLAAANAMRQSAVQAVKEDW